MPTGEETSGPANTNRCPIGVPEHLPLGQSVVEIEGSRLVIHRVSPPFPSDAISVNKLGWVAFEARVESSGIEGSTTGIFLAGEGDPTSLVLGGEPAPGTQGGTFAGFESVSLNDVGEVAFLARIENGQASDGTPAVYGVFVVPEPSRAALATFAIATLCAQWRWQLATAVRSSGSANACRPCWLRT